MTDTSPPFLGIISGDSKRSHAEVADRADRIAGGLQRLGVKQGDSVRILMRNDIAFIQAAYAAIRLGAHPAPIHLHLQPRAINYVPNESLTTVLGRHAALLH